MNHNTPLRKARLALGLTTAEAGQYVHVTRKTWEAWEAKEAAGQPVPPAALDLFCSKLDALAERLAKGSGTNERGQLVVVLHAHPGGGADVPADVVSSDNYLGNDPTEISGFHVIKSLAVDRLGKPYVHRTRYEDSRNTHVLSFCDRHTSVAN